MKEPTSKPLRTEVTRIIKARRKAVYQACLDPNSLARWRVPDSMKGEVHEFEAREGGRFCMSLTYLDPQQSPRGKTTADTDTFRGRFVALVADEMIVEAIEFDSSDPRFAGEMRMTTQLADADGGTEVTIVCENLPAGIRPEDNEQGCIEALKKLATLLE